MNFTWTQEQEQLFERALSFARERLNSTADSEGQFSRRAWDMCGEFGFSGLCISQEYGGLGLDALETAHLIEALGEGCEDGGLVLSIGAHLLACARPIQEHAQPALANRILPKLCTGEWIGANALTESGSGSDAFALDTRAVKQGDHYVINGTKTFVTNAPVADVFTVYATTNPKLGYFGVTAFAVEKDTAGLTVGKPFEKIGLTSSPTSQIYLDDCLVPADNLLGKEGQGVQVFTGSMQWERSCLFAGTIGSMKRVLNRTIDYARERHLGGQPIGHHQAVSHRIVDMKLRLEAARLLLYRACWLRDQGEEAIEEVAMAKLAASEAAVQLGLDAIQMHGGNGVMREYGIERFLRDTIPGTIYSGTSEMQRNIIANMLGL